MKKGFTLIELLAVIVLVAIITLIAIPIIGNVIEKSRIGALKDSAYGLIDEANLYYMQYHPDTNLRFDINDGVISSNDTSKLLVYKGSINNGSVILTSAGKVALCINDGKSAAYKNLLDKEISINNEKNCSIPEGNSIIYLEGTATISELNNQELTAIVQELQTEVAELKKGANPIGTIIAVSHNSIPNGYLACDGQTVSRAEYAELFNLIGTTYGEGDGSTTFNLPDLRGEFLRGTGTNSHANQGSGGTIGEHQNASAVREYHLDGSTLYGRTGNKYGTAGNVLPNDGVVNPKEDTSFSNYKITISGTSTTTGTATSYNTRPTNTSVLYAIRVK